MQKFFRLKDEAGSAHLLLFFVLVLVAVGGMGYFVWQHDHKTNTVASTTTDDSVPTTGTTLSPASSYSPPSQVNSTDNNQALNTDMQSLNSSVNQDNQHVNSTNQSFNDKPINIAQ